MRDSEHLTEPQKEVILRAIDDKCKNNIGYTQGEKIGDAVLKQCLATYEKKAKGQDTCWDSTASVFQYTTDKDVYTFGEDVTITGKYVSPGVTWRHPIGSIVTPNWELIQFEFTTPEWDDTASCRKEYPNDWTCGSSRNDPLTKHDWTSPVDHTFTVSTKEYWIGEVVVEVFGVSMSSTDVHDSMRCAGFTGDKEILRFAIVPVQ